MNPRPAIIDTNVVVAALLTHEPDTPTSRILDGMLRGRFPYVLSVALLAEYRKVLTRRRISDAHGLTSDDVDTLLTALAANAIVREPTPSPAPAPDPGDQHLWDLLNTVPGAILVTGDQQLINNAPPQTSVLSPAAFWQAS